MLNTPGPFLSWAYFRDHWLPGYIMALPMLLACLWVARRGESRFLRVVAIWLAGLLAYLFFVLGPKFLDRNSGGLGKFSLFRPSSLILLLWLLLALAVAAMMLGSRIWILRAPPPDWPSLSVYPRRPAGGRDGRA